MSSGFSFKSVCLYLTIGNYAISVPYLKINQNAPRPSEHPPVRGKKMSKRLGGIIGCKYKTSSRHLNGFPDGSNIGSTVSAASQPGWTQAVEVSEETVISPGVL